MTFDQRYVLLFKPTCVLNDTEMAKKKKNYYNIFLLTFEVYNQHHTTVITKNKIIN